MLSRWVSIDSGGLRTCQKQFIFFVDFVCPRLYHPEGDGQMEQVNQTLEQYLRCYCNYQQDNWFTLLPIAEFTYNNALNETTGTSPFFTNKGYHLTIEVHPERDMASSCAREFAVDLGELHNTLKANIQDTQTRYQKYADGWRRLQPNFKISNKAYVKAQFFRTTRPSKKLSEKNFGHYEIIAQPGSLSYTLRLPQSMRAIHPVYHVSMLDTAPSSNIPNHTEDPPPPMEIEGEVEYEIAEILDTKLDWRRRCKLLYLVRWTGYEGTNEETSWLTADDFHKSYPEKPGPHPS